MELKKWRRPITILAYKDGILAADRCLTAGGTRSSTTKIWRHKKELLGFVGSIAYGMALVVWYRAGAHEEDFPKTDKEVEVSLIVVSKQGLVYEYEGARIPFQIEDPFCAFGSGREGGLVAMSLGCTSIHAVVEVSKFNTDCGMGYDSLSI